jgi:uncharacterized protein (TIGR00297 family)
MPLGGPTTLWTALILTGAFAALARYIRGVTTSGAIAGAGVCFLLYLGGGPGAFAALVSVFVLTWVSTRLGYQRKKRLGTAERLEGRTALQVLANLAVAAGCSALSIMQEGKTTLLLAASAALSEAAADTVSSEIGQAGSDKARLITTWQEVGAGSDGGVSLPGTTAGLAAAILVGLVCMSVGLVPGRWLGIVVVSAAVGMVADSFLGALLERRHLLNNNGVNFLGTLIAAATAYLLA